MPIINIEGLVSFWPNDPVFVHEKALNLPPQRLYDLVKLAYSHMNDEALIYESRGAGYNLLSGYAELTYDEYLGILEQIGINEAGARAKAAYTKQRRAEFNALQPHLVLAMIDSGMPYVCALPGCGITEHLTVDHVLALSRGGTDELKNLRFLCRSHNSSKNDRDEDDFLPMMKKLPTRAKP